MNSIAETFADEQVLSLGLVRTAEHPTLGPLGLIRNAVTMSDGPDTVRSPSPDLGEHTDEVLRDFGIDQGRIDQLRETGVI